MKKINTIALLFCCCATVMLSVQAQTQPQPRIINGKPASTSTYPWMVSLYIYSEEDSESGGGCGGSLIAPDWVLTAAHCFMNDEQNGLANDPASLTELTMNTDNIWDLSSGVIERTAKRVLIHPEYQPDSEIRENTHDFDIALVELDAPVDLEPIKLYTGAVPANIPTIVAGWGATVGKDGTEPSNDLLQTQLVTLTQEACEEIHYSWITSNMFCAGSYADMDDSDTCQGDSGGPLFANLSEGAMQIGITSFGGSDTVNCGEIAGVYAKISELFSFINSHATGFTVVNSLADIQTHYNFYDPVTDSVTIPKVYGEGLKYSVTLKHTGDLHFMLATAEEKFSDDPDAIPSFFDGDRNVLILPLVKVGPDTFNVTLQHLGDFKFVVDTADPI